jgi:uncharacterized membrane protein
MAIALLAAVAVGYAVNAFIGVIAFFVVGTFLSKGSVPKNEMKKVIEKDNPEHEFGTIEFAAKDLLTNPLFKN